MDIGFRTHRTVARPTDAARAIQSRLRRLRLRDRVALVVLAVALVITALVSEIVMLAGLQRQSVAAAGRAWAAETSLTGSSLALADQRTVVQDYLLTRDPRLLDDYRASRDESVRRSVDLAARAARAGAGAGPLEQAAGDWQQWADATVALPSGQVSQSDLERGNLLFDALVVREQELGQRLSTSAAGAMAEGAGRSVLLTAATMGAGVLLMGLLLFLWWQVGTTMLRPIDGLAETARSISRGEASEIPGLDRRDELGELAHALAAWRHSAVRRLELANAVAAEKAQQAHTLDLLNQAVTAMSGVLQPDAVSQVLCEKARALLAGAEVLVVTRSSGRDALHVVAHDGEERWHPGLAVESGSVVDRASRSSEPVLAHDHRGAWPGGRGRGGRSGVWSIAAVPLPAGPRIWVLVAAARGARRLGERDLRMLTLLAAQAAPALEAARLHTELVRAHEALIGTNAELAAASRRRSDFLSSLSHELRTPLNAILGLSRVVLDSDVQAMEPDRLDRFLRHIHDSGKHLLDLVNDVLDLAKAEAGRMELHVETIDLAATISSALATMQPLAEQEGIELRLDSPGPLLARADDSLVQHMLLNLVSNAIKFTPRGGSVTVTARREAQRFVISVADTGVGIAREDHERIFEEFQQVHPPGERRPRGTGLGLALTRRWVGLHGGRIWVDSEPGRGSRFFIELPAVGQGTGAARSAR